MSTNNVVQKEKTSPKLAFGYGIGEVAQQLSWYMINNYLTIFYTDVVGLTATAISLIMLIARVWDAVNDPIMGNIADKTNTRWGKFRPYLMFAPPFLAIFNLLTFTVWPVEGALKVILCLVCYIGTGMVYTVLGTAHAALVNVIAIDSQVRMNLSTARGIGSGIISIILSAVVMPMILFFGKSDVATGQGYFWTAVVLSVVMIPCFLIEAVICKETYTDKLHGEHTQAAQKSAGFVGIYFFGASSTPLLMVLSFMCGLCNSSGALSYGMVSDCIEYGAWKLGMRQEGLAASFLTLAVKCSTAICGVAGVQCLALVGYVPNAEQTPSAITGINFVVNIIPAICGVISILPLFGYSLTEKRVAEIRAELDARGE